MGSREWGFVRKLRMMILPSFLLFFGGISLIFSLRLQGNRHACVYHCWFRNSCAI